MAEEKNQLLRKKNLIATCCSLIAVNLVIKGNIIARDNCNGPHSSREPHTSVEDRVVKPPDK